MNHMRMGEDNEEDRKVINEHFVGNNKIFPTDPNTATACATNIERNAVELMTWKKYLANNHPKIHNDGEPPEDVLFIECSMWQAKKRVSQIIHDISHIRLGDNNIRSTEYSCKGSKISPVMRCYPGSHHMVNINEELKEKMLEMAVSASADQ